MSVNSAPAFPQRKLKYRFTCFISRGDLDGSISYSDGEESDSFTCPKSGDDHEIKSADAINGPSSISSSSHEDSKEPTPEPLPPTEKPIFEKTPAEEIVIGPIVDSLPSPEDDQKMLVREGYKPRDGTDPKIYSTSVGVPPKSFITTNISYDPKCPPPTYFSPTELNSCRKRRKEEFMAGFSIPPEGGLHCIDKEALSRQSGVLTDMLKQLFTKFSIEKISLPVRIFEPRSTCERIVDLWRFAPYYLSNAATSRDPLERFKQVIAFAVSGMYCSAQQLKPFNPLLGETLEGDFSDGTKVYVEHTSHHPPMSHFYMLGPNTSYKMYGHYIYRIHMSGNTLEGQQEGPNVVEFSNGQKITFRYPKIKIHGMIYGKRMIYPSGVMTFEDPDNRLRAAVVFNHGKSRGLFSSRKKGTKIDDFDGIMYYAKRGSKMPKIEQLKELTDVERPVGQVTGSWLKSLKISGATFWDIDRVQPFLLEYGENPLPSDWRFREDLIWLRRNNMEISQEWKMRLEAEQRRDEKMRDAKRKK